MGIPETALEKTTTGPDRGLLQGWPSRTASHGKARAVRAKSAPRGSRHLPRVARAPRAPRPAQRDPRRASPATRCHPTGPAADGPSGRSAGASPESWASYISPTIEHKEHAFTELSFPCLAASTRPADRSAAVHPAWRTTASVSAARLDARLRIHLPRLTERMRQARREPRPKSPRLT